MTSIHYVRNALFILACIGACNSWAGNKLINVQGKLTDPAGVALSGTRIVTFRLYKGAVGAPTTCTGSDPNCVWMESQSVTLQNGLFNVALGSSTSLDNVLFNVPYYLGMQVAGDANELQPRQLLGASAYALGSLGDFTVKGSASVAGNFTAGAATVAGHDLATGINPPGAITMFAGTTPPKGYLLCDGSAVSRATYSGLFAAIGTVWGPGDGSTTFNLPDLRGRLPIGGGQGAGLTSRRVGETFGEEKHAFSVDEMPAHSHGVTDPGHTHDGYYARDVGFIAEGYQLYGIHGIDGYGSGLADGAPHAGDMSLLHKYLIPAAKTGISIEATGGGIAHNIMPPSAGVNFLIKT